MNWIVIVWLLSSKSSTGERLTPAWLVGAVVTSAAGFAVSWLVSGNMIVATWATVGIFVVVLAAMAATAILARRRLERMAARQRAGQCVRCGYCLLGSMTTACPECGAPCVAHRPRLPTSRPT